MAKRKIAHVITFINERGTTPTVISAVKHDKEFEHIFVGKLVTSDEAKEMFESLGSLYVLDKELPDLFDYPSLPQLVEDLGVDLVHIYLPGENLPSYVSQLRCKVILTVNCTKGCNFGPAFFENVIVPSGYSATLNPQLNPVVIPYGLEEYTTTVSREDCLSKYIDNVDENTVVISRVGSIEGVKHIEDSIAVAAHFAHLENVFFIIGGKDPNQAINYLAGRYGATNVISAGFITEEEKAALYFASDFCLYPSEFEAFGFSILEPMIAHKPVVSYNESAIPETIGPGGIVVPFKDLNALAEATASLISRPALRKELGEKAYNWYKSNFSADKYSKSIIDTYRRALNG